MEDQSQITVLCFGEVLYDMFPGGKQPGGAPMNVAVHLANYGVKSTVLSCVGEDDLGKELLAFLSSRNVDTKHLQVSDQYPTGTVTVDIQDKSDPQYTIVEGVAWDHISSDFTLGKDLKYIVHGSLACRTKDNVETLKRLKSHYTNSRVVFDINLRAPYYSNELIQELVGDAHILKINDEEFELLCEWNGYPEASESELLEKLNATYPQLEIIILTKGAEGATVLCNAEIIREPSKKIDVLNTVGAGDSFLGAFLSEIDKGPEAALKLAIATGAYVATQPGATPQYGRGDILDSW